MSSKGTNSALATSRAKKQNRSSGSHAVSAGAASLINGATVTDNAQPSKHTPTRNTATPKPLPPQSRMQRPSPVSSMPGGTAGDNHTTRTPTSSPRTSSVNAGSGITALLTAKPSHNLLAPSSSIPSSVAIRSPLKAPVNPKYSKAACQAVREARIEAQSLPDDVVLMNLFDKAQDGFMHFYERNQVVIAGYQQKLIAQLKEKEEECRKLQERLLGVEKLKAEERGRSVVEVKNLRRQLEEGETDAEKKERERLQKEEQEKEKQAQERVNRHLLEKHEEERKVWKRERERWVEEKGALVKKVERLEREVKGLGAKSEASKQVQNVTEGKANLGKDLKSERVEHGGETITLARSRDGIRASRLGKRKRDDEDGLGLLGPKAKRPRLQIPTEAEEMGTEDATDEDGDLQDEETSSEEGESGESPEEDEDEEEVEYKTD